MFYRTAESLELDLEAVDVRKGEYRAFDAQGQILSLSIEQRTTKKTPWFLGGDWKAEFVCVAETGVYSTEELKFVLTEFLTKQTDAPATDCVRSLEDLVKLGVDEIGFE